MCLDNHCDHVSSYLFDGSPYQPNNPTRGEKDAYAIMRQFFADIGKISGYKVILGRTMPVYDKYDRKIVNYLQKGVDVRLSLDVVELAKREDRNFERVLLVSGDLDLEPAVIELKKIGVKVTLCHSEGQDNVNYSKILCATCDDHFVLGQEFMNKCFLI